MDIKRNGIYHSDCLVLLERIESEIVSLAYIDPHEFTPPTRLPTTYPINVNESEETKTIAEYLSLITKVIQQIHRVLNVNGNIFFHSEHYLAGDYRKILDGIFGREHFRAEIILPNFRTNRLDVSGPRMEHHTIFYYSKGKHPVYNRQYKRVAVDDIPVYARQFKRVTTNVEIGSVWDDVHAVSELSDESINFQAQQPLFLVDRIIKMGSNPGDLILDPFCGSSTTLISAHNNKRRWLGCDLSKGIYSSAVQRIVKECQIKSGVDFNRGNQFLLKQGFPVVYDNNYEVANRLVTQLPEINLDENHSINIKETRQKGKRKKVFISYSRKDEKSLEKLHSFLDTYERSGLLDIWDDSKILVGTDWRKEIKKALEDAKVAVLLVSQDFLASKFIVEDELPPLLAATTARGTKIIPVILTHCMFEDSPLHQFQAVNNPSKPLKTLRTYERDAIWKQVAKLIKDA